MPDRFTVSTQSRGQFDPKTGQKRPVFGLKNGRSISARETLRKVAGREARPPKEASVVATILRRLNAVPGCKAEKVHGGAFGKRGKPDITGCVLGRRFDIEVKVGKNRPTPAQLKAIEEWKAVGGIAGWVTSWAETVALFRSYGLDVERAG